MPPARPWKNCKFCFGHPFHYYNLTEIVQFLAFSGVGLALRPSSFVFFFGTRPNHMVCCHIRYIKTLDFFVSRCGEILIPVWNSIEILFNIALMLSPLLIELTSVKAIPAFESWDALNCLAFCNPEQAHSNGNTLQNDTEQKATTSRSTILTVALGIRVTSNPLRCY